MCGIMSVMVDHLEMPGSDDEAVSRCRQAVAEVGPDSGKLRGLQNNLARALTNRSECTGDLADLDEAISLYRELVTVARSHPGLPGQQNNLAAALIKRYERTGNAPDRTEAIRLYEAAVSGMRSDHPVRPLLQNELAAARSK